MNVQVTAKQTERAPVVITGRALLWVYAVIPAILLVIFGDMLFFDGSLKIALPRQPDSLAYWTILFGFPHIFASMVTFVDREYIEHYKWPLLRGLGMGFLAAVISPIILGSSGFFLILALYTVYHMVMQQYGISLMLLQHKPDQFFQMYRWLSVISAFSGYLYIYLPPSDDARSLLLVLSLGCCVFASMAGVKFLRTAIAAKPLPRHIVMYFVASMLMIPASVGVAGLGYGFFAIVLPRAIHDITGFIVYMAHDQNRNRSRVINPFYWPFARVGIPPYFACVPIAMILSYVLLYQMGKTGMIIAIILGFAHYYLEGIMWRRGSLHRQAAVFAP